MAGAERHRPSIIVAFVMLGLFLPIIAGAEGEIKTWTEKTGDSPDSPQRIMAQNNTDHPLYVWVTVTDYENVLPLFSPPNLSGGWVEPRDTWTFGDIEPADPGKPWSFKYTVKGNVPPLSPPVDNGVIKTWTENFMGDYEVWVHNDTDRPLQVWPTVTDYQNISEVGASVVLKPRATLQVQKVGPEDDNQPWWFKYIVTVRAGDPVGIPVVTVANGEIKTWIERSFDGSCEIIVHNSTNRMLLVWGTLTDDSKNTFPSVGGPSPTELDTLTLVPEATLSLGGISPDDSSKDWQFGYTVSVRDLSIVNGSRVLGPIQTSGALGPIYTPAAITAVGNIVQASGSGGGQPYISGPTSIGDINGTEVEDIDVQQIDNAASENAPYANQQSSAGKQTISTGGYPYRGQYRSVAEYLLNSVHGWPGSSPPSLPTPSGQRDALIEAAIVDAWGAEAEAQAGRNQQASLMALTMHQNLSNAYSLRSYGSGKLPSGSETNFLSDQKLGQLVSSN